MANIPNLQKQQSASRERLQTGFVAAAVFIGALGLGFLLVSPQPVDLHKGITDTSARE